MAIPTKQEVIKKLYEQDSRWANITQQALNRKHPLAQRALAFIKTDQIFDGERAFGRGWEAAFTHVIKTAPDITKSQWPGAYDELLQAFNRYIYPAARKAGFPESSFLFPDITLCDPQGVQLGAARAAAIGATAMLVPPVGLAIGAATLASNLFKLLKSSLNNEQVQDVMKLSPAGQMVLKVNEVITKAKSGDKTATAKVAKLKELADAGDPKAQAAVNIATKLNDATNEKAAKTSYYDRGVTVGHDPYTFVGAVRPGYSYNYTTNSWYRTPKGKQDIPGPCGPGAPSRVSDYRKGSSGSGGGSRAVNSAVPRAALQPQNTQMFPVQSLGMLFLAASGYTSWMQVPKAVADHFHTVRDARLANMLLLKSNWLDNKGTRPKPELVAFVKSWMASTGAGLGQLVQRGQVKTQYSKEHASWDGFGRPSQEHDMYTDAMGITQPQPQDPYGYGYGDPYGYGYGYGDPYGGMAYGQGIDPFYGMNVQPYNPYGGYGGYDPYYDPGFFTNPANQVYDPATDSFYSGCQKMAYDPYTDSFAPVQSAPNPYAYDGYNPYMFIGGWGYSKPYRSNLKAALDRNPANVARALYNRGMGQ